MSITDEHGVDTTPGAATIDLTETAGPAEPVAEQSSGRPQFTITDAASACAVSRKTITRKLADLAEHGAAKDEDGIWRIPVEALLAVGLHPGRSVPERPAATGPSLAAARPVPGPVAVAGPDMITVPRDRWDDLRIRLARAEAQAAERDLALADARLALRALTAAPAGQPGRTVGSVESAASPNVVAEAAQAQAAPVPSGPLPGPQPPGTISAGTPIQPVGVTPPPSTPASGSTADPVAQTAMARSEAARSGGYVPAANAPAKRRRWWQSK